MRVRMRNDNEQVHDVYPVFVKEKIKYRRRSIQRSPPSRVSLPALSQHNKNGHIASGLGEIREGGHEPVVSGIVACRMSV